MNAEQLYEEWTDGETNGMRPERVQAVRNELAEVTDLSIPRRVTEIEGWLEVMRQSGTITRKLRAAAEGTDEEDPPPDEEEPDE